MIRRVIFEIVVIAFLSVLLALGASLLRPHALSWVAQEKPAAKQPTGDVLYKQITVEQAGQLHARGEALFADARTRSAFEAGHIAGAVNLDPNDFDQWSQHLAEDVDMDRTVVAYCDGARCPLAEELAEKLTWLGFENVFYLKDGWTRWQAAGLPIETGG